ncbi:MAG: DMT family transporter, partial [Verrucomicrobia bacterium]|nr:DMT family transporter [Verrucomicrobiota bacterium]
MLPAFLTTVCFSLSVVFANQSTRLLGGLTANFWRIVLATLFLAVWAHGFGLGLGGGAFGVFFLSGCVGFGLGDVAMYQALPRLGSRLTILMVQCLAAPFAAASEWLWLGTTLSTAQILSGLLILTGVAIALAPNEHLHLPPPTLARGIFFGTVAAFGQGFGAVLTRKANQVAALAGHSVDGGTAAYQRILGGLLIAALTMVWLKRRKSFWTGTGVDTPSATGRDLWRRALVWVFLNSLAGPTVGVSCYQWALRTTPSGVVLPIVATTPLVVIPFTLLFEGDRPGPRSVAGGVVAVVGA